VQGSKSVVIGDRVLDYDPGNCFVTIIEVRTTGRIVKASVLELAELQLLLSKLFVRERTLALLDAATGLRVSELLALRWSDVDFEDLELRVTRSIWRQVVGKTEASAKPVPMDSYMAEDILRWRRQSTYTSDDDHVFANETMRGKQPYWPDNLMKRDIRPVATNGTHKNIGWHTFDTPWHVAEGKGRGCQNRSGAFATREQQNNARCLHASCELEQAGRTEQGC
jgi:integrase